MPAFYQVRASRPRQIVPRLAVGVANLSGLDPAQGVSCKGYPAPDHASPEGDKRNERGLIRSLLDTRQERLKSKDALYQQAIEVIVREGRGSVSLLQGSLGVGYGRASRLIDFMADGEPAAGGVAFAIVLGVAVLAVNGFGRQGNDFGEVGVDDDGAEHLVVEGNRAVVVRARHAVVAVDLLRAEVFDAVEGHQVVAVKEGVLLQNLAALHLAKDILEGGTKPDRVHLVEDLAHLGVAGDALQAEDRMQIVVQSTATEGKQRGVLQGEDGEARHQGVGQGIAR
jgi:hypothetical protein